MGAFRDWYEGIWGKQGQIQAANQTMQNISAIEALDTYYNSLPDDIKNDSAVKTAYEAHKDKVQDIHARGDPVKDLILSALDKWVKKVQDYDLKDPAKAKETLAGLTANIVEISGTAFAAELALGEVPFTQGGPVSQATIGEIMAWLGFGAVINAVAHDPVKIGVLRPYEDSLEATFRNRRPDDNMLFRTYQQRSLSPTKIEDVSKITDTLMAQIEAENEKFWDTEIAKWGYSELFSNSLKDAATRTMSFSNLMALARQGRLNRGMAIFSLWGYGLDRRLMGPALEALDQTNTVANYDGFRTLIEPAYTEGDIEEADLIAYWDRIAVPKDVQGWVLPRLKKKREAFLAKQEKGTVPKERDLTVSQIQQAYQYSLQDRASSQNMILSLGYSLDEAKILLDLAEMRRKLPKSTDLKRLPLSDYEKAYKNKLISLNDVLQRMEGEYSLQDISLERALLEAGKA